MRRARNSPEIKIRKGKSKGERKISEGSLMLCESCRLWPHDSFLSSDR